MVNHIQSSFNAWTVTQILSELLVGRLVFYRLSLAGPIEARFEGFFRGLCDFFTLTFILVSQEPFSVSVCL